MNINKIIVGTANFGNPYGLLKSRISKKNFIKICNYYKKKNVNLILDTAFSYKSFEILGPLLLNRRVKIISKFPIIKKKLSENEIERIIVKNLKKLKQKSFYAILIHHTKILNNYNGKLIFKVLKKMKKKGLIKKIGFSIYEPKELKKFYKKFKPDILQIPLNLFNQDFVYDKYFQKLNKKNLEIHARSIFLQGLLLKKSHRVKKNKILNDHISNYNNWLYENKIQSLSATLSFANKFKFIDKFVLGISRFSEFKEIVNLKPLLKKIDYGSLISDNRKIIDPRKW